MPFMDKALGNLTAIPPTRKAAARAAFVDVKEPARLVLAECFKQFGIEAVAMTSHTAERLAKEKFEACVVKLSPAAEKVMEAARSSPSNSRMIIYGYWKVSSGLLPSPFLLLG